MNAFELSCGRIDVEIESGEDVHFAIVVCDVNGLKETNDNIGGHVSVPSGTELSLEYKDGVLALERQKAVLMEKYLQVVVLHLMMDQTIRQ